MYNFQQHATYASYTTPDNFSPDGTGPFPSYSPQASHVLEYREPGGYPHSLASSSSLSFPNLGSIYPYNSRVVNPAFVDPHYLPQSRNNFLTPYLYCNPADTYARPDAVSPFNVSITPGLPAGSSSLQRDLLFQPVAFGPAGQACFLFPSELNLPREDFINFPSIATPMPEPAMNTQGDPLYQPVASDPASQASFPFPSGSNLPREDLIDLASITAPMPTAQNQPEVQMAAMDDQIGQSPNTTGNRDLSQLDALFAPTSAGSNALPWVYQPIQDEDTGSLPLRLDQATEGATANGSEVSLPPSENKDKIGDKGKIEDIRKTGNEVMLKYRKEKGRGQYFCTACKRNYKFARSFKRHWIGQCAMNRDRVVVVCDDCDYICPRPETLERHCKNSGGRCIYAGANLKTKPASAFDQVVRGRRTYYRRKSKFHGRPKVTKKSNKRRL